MFDSDSFTTSMLSNPTKMAATIIDAMQTSDTNGTISINDPNNGFTMQLFANLCIFAKFSEKVDYVTGFFYPQRARNAEQLYPHLSEFDYVDLMASPATLPFLFALSKDWIIANSIYYDTNYNKLEIPATSYFTMGGIKYSMYYPIEILVNRNTGAVTAIYNTSSTNNLNTLSSNMLIDVQEFTKDGLNYFQIVFNMYQFERVSTDYTVGVEQGFIKTLTYEDQFYAVKVLTKNQLGNWIELAYSLSSMYYDFQTPTAILSLLNDTSQLKIEIPQIYFDNGQIAKTVRVELYTTKGVVNYSLSQADVTGLTANFDTKSSVYAVPLEQMPTYLIIPTTTEVAGGSDVKTYQEIRDAVVNQQLYSRVAVTTPEIIEAGKKAGFNLTRIVDDLTERMYMASNILTDSDNMVVPTFAGNILIADQSLESNPSTILKFTDGYYTLLPTTTFTIENNSLTCVPMTDGQVANMARMTNAQLIAELNKGTYVRQPFHITLITTSKSPKAQLYNLLSPSMTSLVFVAENAHSSPQMSATSCIVTHLDNGTGGYQITLGMTKSSNIRSADASNFNVFLTCKTKTGNFVYLPVSYVSTNSNNVDTWSVKLSTSYHITVDDFLTVLMYNTDDVLSSVEIPLDQTFTIITSFKQSFDTSIPVDTDLNALLPSSQQNALVVMAQQTMSLSLGQNMSTQVYCGVNTSWGNDVYKTADETVYYKTDEPVFQTTETGVINTRVNTTTNHVEVVVVYQQHTTPSDTQDLSIKTTADVLVSPAGTTSIVVTVEDSTGLLIGMPARGTGVPLNATVQQINGKLVTLSGAATTTIVKGTLITFTNGSYLMRTTVAQANAGKIISVASTANLLKGQSVFGFDIPQAATVEEVTSPTTFTLSVPTTNPVANNTLLTFINTTAPGVVKIAAGDIITDPTGSPVIVKDAQNQYLIPSILFDGRLFASGDVKDQYTVSIISQRLQDYANQIKTIDAGLIEDSYVYYKPARTMGYATFGIGAGKTVTMSLELSFSVVVYVDASVYNTQTLLSTMSKSIVSIINSAIQSPIISISDMTSQIKDSLGTNVSAVEMGGISGDPTLRLVSLDEYGATPSIENILSIESDGTITRSPNIAITYRPKPDTSETTLIASL